LHRYPVKSISKYGQGEAAKQEEQDTEGASKASKQKRQQPPGSKAASQEGTTQGRNSMEAAGSTQH
jgi:hypothetical protein